jgi:hypothetical protein
MAHDVEKLDPRNDWIVVAFTLVVISCVVAFWQCLSQREINTIRKDLDILVRRVERLEAVPK